MRMVYTINIVDVVVAGVGAVGLLLCGIVFIAACIKDKLEKRRKK